MKKFLIALSIILLLVVLYLWYELKQAKDELLMPATWDRETISQLETTISELQSENQLLKDALSWATESLNSLQVEESEVENSLSWNEDNSNAWNNETNTSSTSNATTNNWKEVWIIKQIYNDPNWNNKIEIDYVQLRWYGENGCDYPLCIVNENSKLRTFTVSNNVQVIMQTFSHTSDGNFNSDQVISFDVLKQIFNDTNNSYNEYQYLKDTPFRITIENDIIVKIEEQYLS